MLNELDDTRMETQVCDTPPGMPAIKVELKEENCEDLIQSAFLLDSFSVKTENDENIDEYVTLSEDYSVNIEKLKSEDSEDSKEWLNKSLVKKEKTDDEIADTEDQVDNFVDVCNIKNEEMHIKDDESINEPGLNKPLIKKEKTDDEIADTEDQVDNFVDVCNIKNEEMHIKDDESINEPGISANSSAQEHERKNTKTYVPLSSLFNMPEKDSVQEYETDNIKKLTKTYRLARKIIFHCQECKYKTYSNCSFSRHLLQHNLSIETEKLQLPLFSCNQCSFKAKNKGALIQHLLLHKKPGEIPEFKCDKCTYKTTIKKNLISHQNRGRHKTAKETEKVQIAVFRCNLCRFKTTTKSCLNAHLLHKTQRVVTRVENQYKCDKCTYTTMKKGCLTKHLISHMDSKILKPEDVDVIKCSLCDYMANSVYNLRKHIKGIHI